MVNNVAEKVEEEPTSVGVNVDELPEYMRMILHKHIAGEKFSFRFKTNVVENFQAYVSYHTPKDLVTLPYPQRVKFVPANEYDLGLKQITEEAIFDSHIPENSSYAQEYKKLVSSNFDTLFDVTMKRTGLSGAPVLKDEQLDAFLKEQEKLEAKKVKADKKSDIILLSAAACAFVALCFLSGFLINLTKDNTSLDNIRMIFTAILLIFVVFVSGFFLFGFSASFFLQEKKVYAHFDYKQYQKNLIDSEKYLKDKPIVDVLKVELLANSPAN